MLKRFLKAIAMTGVMLGGLAFPTVPILAQATQPSVSVVTFEGSSAPRDARDAMADELAARLVDTGHFRVLRREWFPHESDAVPSLDVLRAAAKSVNVDYLVFGSIRQSTGAPVPQPNVMTSSGMAPAFGRQVMLRTHTASPRLPAQTTVVVSVRVVDVASADVVRTATAQRTYAARNGSPSPLVAAPILSRPPTLAAAAVAAIAASRSKLSSTRLTKDWRQVVQQVAQQLDVRGLPAPGGR